MSVISSRDDYLFIDPVNLPEDSSERGKAPGRILYGGDIMPLRESGDMTMRGIDPLFLANRMNMLHSMHVGSLTTNLRFYSLVRASTLERIRKSVVEFADIGKHYTGYNGGICGIPGTGIYEIDKTSSDWFGQVPGATVDIAWKCPESAFADGGNLKKSYVLDLFDDCRQDHVCIKGDDTRFVWQTTEFTHSYSGGGTYVPDPGPIVTPSDVVYEYRALSTNDGDGQFFRREDSASDTDVRFVFANGVQAYPASAYPSSVRMVVYMSASLQYYRSSDGKSRVFYRDYALVAGTSVSKGEYSVSTSDIMSVVDRAKHDAEFEEIDTGSDLGERLWLNVHMFSPDAVLSVPDGYDWIV